MICLRKAAMVVGLLALVLPGGSNDARADDAETMFGPPAPKKVATETGGDSELNALELCGISTLGGQNMFNFVNGRTKQSFWLAVNGSVNGFSIVSYDEKSDTVVIARNGKARSVTLRQAQIAALPAEGQKQAPKPVEFVPPPTVDADAQVVFTPDGGEIKDPKTPQEIAQAEMEARMMVSDLLEISMQERARQKALREAKLRQQQGASPAAKP